ncbi:MAG: hypothetical protein ABW090_05680 [Sedimenticola sp.]
MHKSGKKRRMGVRNDSDRQYRIARYLVRLSHLRADRDVELRVIYNDIMSLITALERCERQIQKLVSQFNNKKTAAKGRRHVYVLLRYNPVRMRVDIFDRLEFYRYPISKTGKPVNTILAQVLHGNGYSVPTIQRKQRMSCCG